MLTVVLLHVVAATVKVDPALDPSFSGNRSRIVQNHFSLFDDAGDRDAINRAEIVRLSAGFGIEKGFLQSYRRPVGCVQAVDNDAFELGRVGIG